jgi:nicotinamidase-related amidase
MMFTLPAQIYQQFDADFSLDVPAEGYGGWQHADIEIAPEHTAVVVMHAWDCGTREEFPGWHRAVEYLPRANAICRDVFPLLLKTVRASPLQLFHVVRGAHPGIEEYSGYRRAVQLAGKEPEVERVPRDATLQKLQQFRARNVFPGAHNQDDIARGFEALDFSPEARPHGDEGIAETSAQLFALCKNANINHLIYAGFAIDGCLLSSPGGMHDMSARGVMCSTFSDAVTAIEHKESAREEWAKKIALWRVAVLYGFVFQTRSFCAALERRGAAC